MCIRDRALDEPYIAEKINTLEKMGDMTYPQTVPEGCIYVLGDNRNYSTDSRWSSLGMVDERYIPVSYTHLDVYKRQCPDGCVLFRLTAEKLGNENFFKGKFFD